MSRAVLEYYVLISDQDGVKWLGVTEGLRLRRTENFHAALQYSTEDLAVRAGENWEKKHAGSVAYVFALLGS